MQLVRSAPRLTVLGWAQANAAAIWDRAHPGSRDGLTSSLVLFIRAVAHIISQKAVNVLRQNARQERSNPTAERQSCGWGDRGAILHLTR